MAKQDWALQLLGVLLISCSDAGQYRAYSAVTAAPELLDACERAADRWAQATGLLPACDHGLPLEARPLGGRAGGITTGEGIFVDPERMQSLECADLVIAHELGHAMLGGGHGHPAQLDGSLMAAMHDSCDEPLTAENLRWFCDEGAPCQWELPE